MTTTDTVQRVRAFVAKETGRELGEILPETRLHADLGLDGPNAVTFIENYGATFRVDVEDVWTHWRHYFRSEGMTLSRVLMILCTLPLMAVSLIWGPGVIPAPILYIGIAAAALFVVWFVFRGASQIGRRREITVGELVQAVDQERLRLKSN